ncbi:MAG: hypothetical protein NT157_02025 [Candidatus Micrarchaeota archaeon]|nr:hypothetical protein [Candidatus Micrarchaeota archaeon]
MNQMKQMPGPKPQNDYWVRRARAIQGAMVGIAATSLALVVVGSSPIVWNQVLNHNPIAEKSNRSQAFLNRHPEVDRAKPISFGPDKSAKVRITAIFPTDTSVVKRKVNFTVEGTLRVNQYSFEVPDTTINGLPLDFALADSSAISVQRMLDALKKEGHIVTGIYPVNKGVTIVPKQKCSSSSCDNKSESNGDNSML